MNSIHERAGQLPQGWSLAPGPSMKGGQATAAPVRHTDGREGVYRELREPMSELSWQRFQRELHILSETVKHRAVVTLYEWSADIDRPWYISELGDPFEKWWNRQREELRGEPDKLVESAISVLAELSSALSVCHDNGIIHRDIKPKNVIMKRGAPETWPILIDFGIAHDEEGSRLTPPDDAVGNARFSPDIMRTRVDAVTPWLDIFDLAQLLVWMLDTNSAKHHWQRPIHWKYAVYDDRNSAEARRAIRAFTAACSTQATGPNHGAEAASLLNNLFPHQPPEREGQIDPRGIISAKRRGESTKLLATAAIAEEVDAAAPLAESVYEDLKATLRDVLAELSAHDTSTTTLIDSPFNYKIVGATDLFWVSVGPQACNIQLRLKAKLVPRSEPLPVNRSNRDHWKKHMPGDAICFAFALEGGVIQAYNARYVVGRWITIRRDGALYMHPLSAAFGHSADNDLGGAVEGPGTLASMNDIRQFAISVLTDREYWEYVASFES